MSKNAKINFYGIGAQKAGTTWLYSNLSKLPDFNLPPIKELHYFDHGADYLSVNLLSDKSVVRRIFSWQWNKAALLTIGTELKKQNFYNVIFYYRWFYLNYNDNWYQDLFKPFKGLTGDITPSYAMLNKKDIIRMYEIAPDAKIIFMLRNPIERAWSHFKYSLRKKNQISQDDYKTENLIKTENHKAQIMRSQYLATLKNFCEVFPAEQILVGFYDAIQDDPNKLLKIIVDFIGGESAQVKELKNIDKRVNTSMKLDIPCESEKYLKQRYYSQIKELSNIFGGYCTKWLNEYYNEAVSEDNNTYQQTIKLKDIAYFNK
ncbi:MAG: sulfotransferase domain-containing protein [bacterium]